ncbi:MAG: AMP-binding protein [Planctomycetes bacterium]|jgi:acyl-CoA synthetase (AMP-forming)/AMP-acid ligase II|nr:AMP-binding protein [Planctomycetota bacterium]
MPDAAPDLLSLLRAAAARGGDAPFFAAGDTVLTWRQFQQRVEQVALGLRAAGLQPGDRLGVLLPRGHDEAITLLAAAVAGGIAVPIHARLKDDQVQHVLADCEPFALVTSAVRLLALRDPAAVCGRHRVFAIGEAALPVRSEPLPQHHTVSADALPLPAPRQPAVLLYSSGSTGLAKGIVQDHHNLCLGAAIIAAPGYLGLGPGDHILALLPFGFDYGLNQLLSALHSGARLTAADHLGAGELAQLLRRHQPTGLAGVPSLWHEVAAGLQSGALTAADGRSLRYVTNSGGALRRADAALLRERWPQVQVFAMYGLTEAFRSAFLPPAEFDAFPDSFGRALPGVELLLVATDTGQVLDGPATGELVHAGALIAHGYWRRPEATSARFRPDPRGGGDRVVYSGDIVRRDDGGRHYFVGRADRLLKVQGHRVSPDEVAAGVAGMPGVGEVAVFGCDGGADGHRIVLVVAGDPADTDLPGQLQRRCRSRLPSYMQPWRVAVLAALPHNANGKVDESALRALVPVCTTN